MDTVTASFDTTVTQIGMCIMEHLDLEVLEHYGIFILNPEYRILFWNNLLEVIKMSWLCRGLGRWSVITQPVNKLVMSLCSAMSLLSSSFSFAGAQSVKFVDIICFANFSIFRVYLIQIDFKSKYSTNSDFWIQILKDLIFHYMHP